MLRNTDYCLLTSYYSCYDTAVEKKFIELSILVIANFVRKSFIFQNTFGPCQQAETYIGKFCKIYVWQNSKLYLPRCGCLTNIKGDTCRSWDYCLFFAEYHTIFIDSIKPPPTKVNLSKSTSKAP